MGSDLEDLSFQNLVLYYIDELRILRDGAPIRSVFTSTQSRTLLKYGVYAWVGGRRGIQLSDKAITVMEGRP